MDGTDFDRLTRTFARPTSRRRALRGLGAATATLGIGLAPGRAAVAQESTPPAAADAAAAHPVFMFVQVADAGAWQPKEGEPGVYLLTLDDVAAETVFFSDRPDRIIGTVPTQTLLDGLGFTPDNPPNAAVVVQTDAGQDVLVVELLNPVYDVATEQLTYEARILPITAGSGELSHLAGQQDDAELPESFGSASLFIDDCPDFGLVCLTDCNTAVDYLGRRGMCWNWSALQCQPCDGGWEGAAAECNAENPVACEGKCFIDYFPRCL